MAPCLVLGAESGATATKQGYWTLRLDCAFHPTLVDTEACSSLPMTTQIDNFIFPLRDFLSPAPEPEIFELSNRLFHRHARPRARSLGPCLCARVKPGWNDDEG